MPAQYFVFADGIASFWPVVIAAAVGAAVAAAVQAGAAVYKRARADATAATVPSAPVESCHWADVTGEHRPVTAQECGARMSGLDETIREIRDAMLKMEAKLEDGVELRMQRVASTESEKAVDRHESARHGGERR